MPATDDDQIEVLSSNLDNGDAVVTQVLPDESSIFLKCLKKKERERKLVSRAVVIISGVLFLLSVILVGVSLMMSRNIDDLVRNSNKMLRKQTPVPPIPPKPVTVPSVPVFNTTTVPP
ncbi:hypothetical protein ScPMuIL_011952 [Solemya velum]